MHRAFIFPIIVLAGLLAIGEASHAATVTWDGSSDMNWTEPDSTSWGADTYAAGDTAHFFDTGAGTVNVAGVAPGGILVDSTANYVFSGGAIGGAGALTKDGSGTLTLSGANTYSGDTTVESGTLQLGSAGSLTFLIGSSGVNNAICDDADADATLYLDGSFDFDLSGAGTTLGDSWEIVDIDSFFNSDIFGSTFSVTDFANIGTGLWEASYAGTSYEFSQTSGLLRVVPEPATFTLLALLLFSLLAGRRRSR